MHDTLAVSIDAARQQTIGAMLRRTAARLPDKVAIICGQTVWTYAEFNATVNRLAAGLHRIGARKGDCVALVSRNSHAFIALRYALAKLGAIFVPINFMLNPDEIAYILQNSGARFLAVGPDFVDKVRAAAALSPSVETLLWLPGEEASVAPQDIQTFDDILAAAGPGPATEVEAEVRSQDICQIIYTSGTESRPKGAILTHEAVMWQYVSCIIDGGMAADDTVLHSLPLYHCAQLDVNLGPSIYLGTTNVITAHPRPDNILALIRRYQITSFFAPPTVWIGMLRDPGFDESLGTLIKGYYGASIMPVEILLELQRRRPELRLWNLYGQTEIAPLATTLQPADQLERAGSAGKPVINVETRVVDEDMNDVAVGEIGEIVHRSPQLMSGYYNDPEKTAAAFAHGWFHSGDLAVVDAQGFISVVDRAKDMIKTGGENVASREVEEAIYRHPAVEEVAVVGLPDPKWVEAVVAVIVLKSGESADTDAILKSCGGVLAPYKLPKRVVFVESLPKNPSGKLLKRELRLRMLEATA